MHCERTGEASSNGALFRQADAAQSDIACQMRGALSRQSARCQRSLLPRLAQAVRSTDRRERTVEDGALRTGSQDSPRNIASFARGPLPNDPQRGAHAVGSGCFSSFQFRNACLGKTGCDFLIIGLCAQIGFSPIRGSTVRPIVRVIGGKLVF